MKITSVRMNSLLGSALLLTLAVVASIVDESCSRAPLQSASERKAAPDLLLRDASGKTASLTDYRGKIVLLDFWATWCTGCKEEIPWFSEFQSRYGAKGFAVVGVSMDEGGWNVVKPFLAENNVPYRMLLGDKPTAQRFGITNLPDTYLIDRTGRVAASYKGVLVKREDVEGRIKTLLSN
jgi:peroxiredoxin